jgi:hypothetical protein
MKRILGYYYFRLYKYYSGGMIPFFSTSILIIVFIYINAITILNVAETAFDKPLNLPTRNQHSLISYVWPLIIVIPVYIVCYNYLIAKNHHVEILEEFSQESKRHRVLYGSLIVLYFVISISLFVFTLWLRQAIRNW